MPHLVCEPQESTLSLAVSAQGVGPARQALRPQGGVSGSRSLRGLGHWQFGPQTHSTVHVHVASTALLMGLPGPHSNPVAGEAQAQRCLLGSWCAQGSMQPWPVPSGPGLPSLLTPVLA